MWKQRKKRVSLVEVETSHDGRAVTQPSVHFRSTMPFLKASDYHKTIQK